MGCCSSLASFPAAYCQRGRRTAGPSHQRPSGLCAACRVLLPTRLRLHLTIELAAAPARIANLGVPIALEKGAEAVVAPAVVARNKDIGRRPARHEAALGLVVQHRDELGAIVGL